MKLRGSNRRRSTGLGRAVAALLTAGGLAGSVAAGGQMPWTPERAVEVEARAAELAAAGRPNEATALLVRTGSRWLDDGAYGAAVKLLELAAESSPESAEVQALLGRGLALEERYLAAETALQRAYDGGRRDLETLFYLGSARWENGRWEEAEQAYREGLERHGPSAIVLHQLGRLVAWRARYAEAIDLLEAGAERSPSDPEVQADLAEALVGVGRSEEAVAAYRRAVAAAPEHSQMRYRLALLLSRLGREKEAAEELEVYRRLYAEDQERTRRAGLEQARLERARELLLAGDAAAAIEHLADLAESADVLAARAAAHDALGDPAAAGGAEEPPERGGSPPECAVPFTEVAAEAGVSFRHDRGASGRKHLPETMGSGLAWLDYDGDGWWDLYVVDSGPFPPAGERSGDRLFRNLGGGRFRAVAGSVDRLGGYGQGVVAADVDGDGTTDLYLTHYGADGLLLNRGDGRLEVATASSGLSAPGWSSSAAFGDGDGDGDLDLYVTRYLEYDAGDELFCGEAETGHRRYCDPSLFAGAGDLYYRNLGSGRFEEATAAAGLTSAVGRGLGVMFTDLDGDRHPDLYVANDLTTNHLFRNRGDGSFEDLSLLSGAAVNRAGRPEAGMGLAVADVDGDLDPDLAVTNFDVETNTLYRNLGEMAFDDVAALSGFGLPSFNRLAFGLVAGDYDLDGAVDLYVANGHIFERPARENVAYRQPDQLFLGDGTGRFDELACPAMVERATVARGAAAADLDNDGDVDLAVQANGGALALLRNDLAPAPWLGVLLRGAAPNTEGVGARLLLGPDGGARQVRWVTAGDSYQSSGDRRQVFGLGTAPDAAALEVVWPSGRRTRLASPRPGRYLVLYEPAG